MIFLSFTGPKGLFCFTSRKFIFLTCRISERVNTVSQSVRSPSSVWVAADVRRASCHFLSGVHWQDECIKTHNALLCIAALLRLCVCVGTNQPKNTSTQVVNFPASRADASRGGSASPKRLGNVSMR